MSADDETQQSLGALIKRAEQVMLRGKNAVLKPLGLSLAQYVALDELERREGTTSAGLARACFVSPQAMMILLKTTEQQGLIERTAHPRHPNVLELHITPVGREALQEGRRSIEPIDAQVYSAFTADEVRAFRDYLSRFVVAFGER